MYASRAVKIGKASVPVAKGLTPTFHPNGQVLHPTNMYQTGVGGVVLAKT